MKGTGNFEDHSPLFMSRFKTEEISSRIFYDQPPVPYRFVKWFLFYTLATMLTGSIVYKSMRRNQL